MKSNSILSYCFLTFTLKSIYQFNYQSMKRAVYLFSLLFFTLSVFSCKNKQITVNPGAQMSVDGTDDGLQQAQRNFEDASRTDRGILVTFDSDLLFPLNSSYLTDNAKAELDKLVNLLQDYSGASLIIDGHTDATGTEDYNQWLSEKRAESVQQYLKENGFPESNMTINGYGQSQPVAPNNTTEGRQQNRRVEVTIVE